MFLVGLTGGIACGKSTVSKMFKENYGCPIIDADLIARQVVEPGRPANRKIREAFGDEVFFEDGNLNRERLGQIIFNDEPRRRVLNRIVHPAIKRQMLSEIFRHFLKGYQFAILDVPLLFETRSMLPFVSFTVVVYCSEDQQLERLMERNNLDEEDATARIESQMSLAEKCKLATFVIDNSGAIEETENSIKKVYDQLKKSKRHILFRLGLVVIILSVGALLFGSAALIYKLVH